MFKFNGKDLLPPPFLSLSLSLSHTHTYIHIHVREVVYYESKRS